MTLKEGDLKAYIVLFTFERSMIVRSLLPEHTTSLDTERTVGKNVFFGLEK